jgi:hypothetical protein
MTISVPMQAPVVRPGRPCSACHHPDLAEIEAALGAGTPLRALAATFATTPAALHRHRAGHMARVDTAQPLKIVSAPAASPFPTVSPPPSPVPARRLLQGWTGTCYAARRGDRCSCCRGNQWWEPPDASRGGCARCAPPSVWGVRRFET